MKVGRFIAVTVAGLLAGCGGAARFAAVGSPPGAPAPAPRHGRNSCEPSPKLSGTS